MWTIKILQSTTTHKVTVKIEEEEDEQEQEQEQEDLLGSVQQHVNQKNTAIYYHPQNHCEDWRRTRRSRRRTRTRTRRLTWISDGDDASVTEVAVPVVATIELVVRVEGIGSMGVESIGLIARIAGLDRNAIGTSFSTSVVQSVGQVLHCCSRLRHTPCLPNRLLRRRSRCSNRSGRRCWRSCRCSRRRRRRQWWWVYCRHSGSRRCRSRGSRYRRCRRRRACGWGRSSWTRRRGRRRRRRLYETHIVDRSLVDVEETEVALRARTRLHILVEESEDEDVEGGARTQGSTGIGAHELDEIAIVSGGVCDPATDLIRVTIGRPSRFRHRERDVTVAKAFHGRVHSVELRV